MRRTSLISLLLMLSGCISQPRALPLVGAASLEAGHRLVVELTLPRQLQATVSRNLVAMIDHYTATLLQWNGSSFVPLASPLSSTTTEQVRPKFAFDHLGPGRYQVRAIGYNASNTALTSEGTADVDLTGNDVDTAPQITVPLTMLPTAFSATLPLPSNATPGSLPSWATGLEAVVSVGGTEIARQSYAPNMAPNLKNLAAGVSYDVTVTASNGLGHTDDDSYTYYADPNAASLDDAPTHAFAWPALITTFPVGTTPGAVAVDGAGNAWVANFGSANVTRISTTGSISTYAVGAGPMDVNIDASGNAWVPNATSNNVTRISATGSFSTFPVGTTPCCVVVDSSGNAWVANSGSANVTRISATGSLSTFPAGTQPRDILVNGGGDIWVVNHGSDNVTRITTTGSISTFPTGDEPISVAVDASGNAWVANIDSTSVTRISSTGSISTFTVGSNPVSVAVDSAGNAWVSNFTTNNVTRISTTGSISTYAVGGGPFTVAVDSAGSTWVANSMTNDVTRISATGSISTFSVGTGPYTVVLDGRGGVWVPNENSNNVTHIQP